MTEEEAKSVVANLPSLPASDYGRAVRAVHVLSEHELGRGMGKGANSRKLGDILAAQCGHAGFLGNHARRRLAMTPGDRDVCPCGTGSNEAVHRELGILTFPFRKTHLELLFSFSLLFMELSSENCLCPRVSCRF